MNQCAADCSPPKELPLRKSWCLDLCPRMRSHGLKIMPFYFENPQIRSRAESHEWLAQSVLPGYCQMRTLLNYPMVFILISGEGDICGRRWENLSNYIGHRIVWPRLPCNQFIHFWWSTNTNFSHTGEESRPVMIAKVDPENIASWKVLEKLGFQKGEVLNNAYQRGSPDETQKRDQIKWYLRGYV